MFPYKKKMKNLKNDGMMEKLMEDIKSRISARGFDCEYAVKEVVKANVPYIGMTCCLKGCNVAPTVNLTSLNGIIGTENYSSALDSLVDSLCESFSTSARLDVSWFKDYDSVKERLMLKVCNVSNGEFLKTVPHVLLEDLAFYPACMVCGDELDDAMGTISITHEHLREWGVNADLVIEDARKVANKNAAMEIVPIDSMMLQFVMSNEVDEELREVVLERQREHCISPLLIATNVFRVNGASVLFYPEFLEQVESSLGCGYYVLPSSLHEVMLLPDCMPDIDLDSLFSMVATVNETQLQPSDFLSNSVYHYADGVFENAKRYEERVGKKGA